VKLDFYSPYGIYLHDTPKKSLFSLGRRYFSHGCIRVEKAFEVAHYILRDNGIAIDTLTEKGCLQNQSPIAVPADEQMPLFIIYNTAGVDSSGRLRFYENIYRRKS
jgi:murein L,D-transpeptidase YcbB/YkuD